MTEWTQQTDRLLETQTPLGRNYLVLTELKGNEAISQPFCYELTLYSHDTEIKGEQLIGKPFSFQINHQKTRSPRYFNGIVNQFRIKNIKNNGVREYQAKVVPWLWFLEKTSDCRIFQNKSTPEIVRSLFKEHGFYDFCFSHLNNTYPKHEYCVQYNESTLHFISRLLEESGLFYFFHHDNDKHTLILGDSVSAYPICPDSIKYRNQHTNSEDYLYAWNGINQFGSQRISQTDYNFLTPNTDLFSSYTADNFQLSHQENPFEEFYYPGHYHTFSTGQQSTLLQMQAQLANQTHISSSGHYAHFNAGTLFYLKEHVKQNNEGDYLMTGTTH